jgi:hypothetical protein
VLLPLRIRVNFTPLRVRSIVDTLNDIRVRKSGLTVNLSPLARVDVFLKQDWVFTRDSSGLTLSVEPSVAFWAGVLREVDD